MSAKELVARLQTHCADYNKPAQNMYQRLSQNKTTALAIRRASELLKIAASRTSGFSDG